MESDIPKPTNASLPQRPQGVAPHTADADQGVRETSAVNKEIPTVIRTMKSDAAEAMRAQNETLVSMTLAEEKKKAARHAETSAKKSLAAPTMEPAPKPIGRVTIIFGLIFLVVGVGVAVKFALPTLRNIDLPRVSLPTFGTLGGERSVKEPLKSTTATPITPSLVPAQSEKRFTVNKRSPEDLFAMVANERTAGVTTGNIRNLYFEEDTATAENKVTTAPISAGRILILANISAPAILARSLETPFMIGLYGEEGAQATPFFIFKVSGYDTGFAGMLLWEKDLPGFFDTIFGTNFLATLPVSAKFHDAVVSGYDVRTLKGSLGESIVYAFVNPTTIIIAGSQSTLTTLAPLLSAHKGR